MKVKKLHPNAKLPTRAENGSTGYDLYSVEEVFIPLGETRIVDTGIAIELESHAKVDYMSYFKIEDRSGMASKGMRTGAGVVDQSYRGPIKVVLHNFSASIHPKGMESGYKINIGDRIAQGIIQYSLIERVVEVDELSASERNEAGFGSSGT